MKPYIFLGIGIALLMTSCHNNVKENNLEQELKTSLAQDTQVQKDNEGVKVTLDDILFDFNKTTLTAKGKSILKKLVAIMGKHSDVVVHVVGHSDNIGSRVAKRNIANGRAHNVARILIKDGIPRSRITYEGRSDREPLFPNTTKKNRSKNRRVELKLKMIESQTPAIKS